MKPTLNPMFTSHMVLQAEEPMRFFGNGTGDIRVTIDGMSAEAVCKEEQWIAELPPMPYGGPYTVTVVMDGDVTILEDVYLGDVYIIAGQSNMQFKLFESNTPSLEWRSNERMRLFSTERIEEHTEEHFHPEDGWVVCEKETAGYWSAIGYHLASALMEKEDVTIGLITCYQGASVIESFVPEGLFMAHGIEIPPEQKMQDHFHELYGRWNGEGQIFHYTVEKISPYRVKAVLWYQGESDTSMAEAAVYDQELALMIDCWREVFRNPKMAFIVIQIADYAERMDEAWKRMQQAQWNVQFLRDAVKTIPCRDICESDSIHPVSKKPLAERIAEYLMEGR